MSTKLNWRSIIKETVEKFKRYSIPDPISSTEFILANVLNCKRADLLLRLDEHPKEDEMERFNNLVSRRLKREPLQ
ncbi:MAG: peptide chain release factor N(5)-glutamine methyltransferase, partial [bacterium]